MNSNTILINVKFKKSEQIKKDNAKLNSVVIIAFFM